MSPNNNPTPSIVSSASYAAAQSGHFFAITTQSRSVAANGFLTAQLTNPANSERMLISREFREGPKQNPTGTMVLGSGVSCVR